MGRRQSGNRGGRRVAARALSTALALLVAGMALPGAASAISAYPFKGDGDTGVVSPADFLNAMSGGNPEGWDACVISDPYNDTVLALQQYPVADCVPIQTPWIQLKALGTRGWAIYCPRSAPNSWIDSSGGGLQAWSDTNSSWAMQEIQADNSYGPNPVAKSDYYMTNWSFKEVHFGFLVGCSPQAWTGAGMPDYCCGAGVSARPSWSTAPGSARGAGAAVTPVTAKAVRGPKRRRIVHSPTRYSETREVNLAPRSKRTHVMRCKRGFLPYHQHWGVGWYTKRTPRPKTDGKVGEFARGIKRGFRVTAKANKRVKRGSARLQASLSCHRKGTPVPNPGPALGPGRR